jgi:hypothetical protein
VAIRVIIIVPPPPLPLHVSGRVALELGTEMDKDCVVPGTPAELDTGGGGPSTSSAAQT